MTFLKWIVNVRDLEEGDTIILNGILSRVKSYDALTTNLILEWYVSDSEWIQSPYTYNIDVMIQFGIPILKLGSSKKRMIGFDV